MRAFIKTMVPVLTFFGIASTAANATPVTFDFTVKVFVSDIPGLPSSTDQIGTGSVTVDSDAVHDFVAAGTVINGYQYTADHYGFSADGILSFDFSLGDLVFTEADLYETNYIAGQPASLVHIFGSLDAPVGIGAFAYNWATTTFAWIGGASCCAPPGNAIYPSDYAEVTNMFSSDALGTVEVSKRVTSVPEPSTALLMAIGIAGVAFSRRRGQSSAARHSPPV
jgi:hypothetical protein